MCLCPDTRSQIIWDLSRGLRDHLSNPDSHLKSPCQVRANWFPHTCTQTRPLSYYTQTALQARGHWQLPVILFPQVPSVTQPLPDRSNHRWGLFCSHPRVKAQRVPKEMTETHESIALFFSSFLTPFWMQVWGLITVSGDEVDFIHPRTHQKKKDCTKIDVLSLAPALEIAIAAPENSQGHNQALQCQRQKGKSIQHPFLTAFGRGFTPLHCFLFPARAPNYQPLGPCFYICPAWDTLHQPHTFTSVYPSSPAQMPCDLWSFTWMTSKISIFL